ncbi:MAG TPA: hypothetical protein VJ913_03195 [Actinomycetota bacterium]|nr:hypothetical protein [Actinomycetota bacterium]
MSDGGTTSGNGSDDTGSEFERLKAERDELAQQVETLEGRPQKRHRLRRILASILVVLTVVVFTVTVPAAWGRRTILNTDRYVATVAPLADDPAVQTSIATRLTDQVFAALNAEDVISNALAGIGERATVLAGPITNALRGFVQEQVLRIVQSEPFDRFWTEANRFVHTQVMAILRGDTEQVSVVEGKVLLNLVPLINLALVQIQGVATDLVGDVTLPTIEAGSAPGPAVAALEQALGIELPETYGTIEVYDSQDLEALQQALFTFQRLFVLLLILIPVLIAVTLLVSTRRRRTLIQLAVGGAVGLVLVRRLAILGRDSLFERVDTEDFPSVRVLTDELMSSLFRYTGILLAIVLITLLIALVTGRYPWAVALRRWVADLGRGIGAAVGGKPLPDTGRVRWVREHRDALMLAGGVLAVVLLLWVDLSWLAFVVVGVLVALYELALWRLAPATGPETGSEAAA